MLKDYLEQTGLFEVTIYTTDSVWAGTSYSEEANSQYKYINQYPPDTTKHAISHDPIKNTTIAIDFSEYDVIIPNLGDLAAEWDSISKQKFETYMQNGGGLVIVHAASNPWGNWSEFNKMIGLGAWGGRDSTSGPYVYYNKEEKLEMDSSAGICGSHGLEQEYIITFRDTNHPITQNLPTKWLHTKDELYDRMRGPFENTTIIATAFSDSIQNAQPWEPVLPGTGRNVPIMMAGRYEKGRIFHTTLGHTDYSMECVGFITTFQRGAEWAATDSVTQTIPHKFPTHKQTESINWNK